MNKRVAINGFGRIGRCFLRESLRRGSKLEIVAINDLTDAATLAHLLEYDSVHGKFEGEVSCTDNSITVNGHKIAIYAEKDPSKLPWKNLNIDLILECTGIFTSKEKAGLHLQAGAKKVLISAPASDPDITIVYGVNHQDYNPTKDNIISCASCTTNCLAPVAKVLDENFGILRGTMTTAHSYTNDQNILDLPHKDLRRARAAAMSMIPTSTGAAKALSLVLPNLKGKIDGFAIRVPTCDVSVVDLVVELGRDVTVEEVNQTLKNAAEGALKGVLDYSVKPLVSVDYIGNPHSSTVDSLCTMVIQKRMAKVIAWYDNEIGFSNRMIDVVQMVTDKI